MSYMLKKTLVIGLGGTGMNAVLYMKKKLLETYGEIPPMIKFRVLDTTDKESLKTERGEITLDPGEFLKLEVKEPLGLIRTNTEVRSWFPKEVPLFALTSGAKAIRSLGRLAAFANARNLYDSINNAMSSLRDYTIGRVSDKYEVPSGNLVVNIVCSLAGGTGAGCFFDVAVIVRKILKSTDRLIGYFLLPDIFTGKPATKNVAPNTYGAFKEIEYFFLQEIRKPFSYAFGGREMKVEGALFDAVYVVNNINKRGIEYSEVKDLTDLLAMGMFLQSSSTGKGARDILDNLEAQLLGRWWGKPTVFSGFGVSELFYPGDWFADLYAKGIALDVLQKVLMGGEVSQICEAVENFIDKMGLREDTADEVINTILALGDFRKFPLPTDFKKEIVQSTIGRLDLHLNEVQRELGEIAKETLAGFKERELQAFNNYLLDRMNESHGLEFCRSFLSVLIGRLQEFKNMMVREKDEYSKQKEGLQGKYELAQSEAEKASRRLFGTKGAIEEALKKYKGIVDKHSSLILEMERREKANEFFAYLIDEAKSWQDRLNSLACYSHALTQELSQEIQRKKLEKKSIKPFIHEVIPTHLKEWKPEVNPQDFLIWLKDTKKISALELSRLRLEEVKEILLEYGNSKKEVQEIRERKIENILKDLSQQERQDLVRILDEMAAPLWQYDTGWVSGDKKTENIYLFGVESREDSIFTHQEIKNMIPMQYEPSTISTGDSKRVICFKVEAAVPAFVISNMTEYREKYSDPDKPFSYHIHKDWERELPDPFPASEEEASRKYWSLALAEPFNLLSRKGEYYYIRSERKGERTRDYLLQLAQGRVEAMKAFLSDPDLINETKENIEKITQKLGNEKVIQTLKAYGVDLEQKAKKQTENIRRQIEQELKDIDDHLTLLSSLA